MSSSSRVRRYGLELEHRGLKVRSRMSGRWFHCQSVPFIRGSARLCVGSCRCVPGGSETFERPPSTQDHRWLHQLPAAGGDTPWNYISPKPGPDFTRVPRAQARTLVRRNGGGEVEASELQPEGGQVAVQSDRDGLGTVMEGAEQILPVPAPPVRPRLSDPRETSASLPRTACRGIGGCGCGGGRLSGRERFAL